MTEPLPVLGAVLYTDPKVTTDSLRRGLVVDIVIGNFEGKIVHGPFIIAVDQPDEFRSLLDNTGLLSEIVAEIKMGGMPPGYGLSTLRLENIPEQYREDWKTTMNKMERGGREKIK